MSDVTGVIVARGGEPDRFVPMVAWSVAVHVTLVAAMLIGVIDLGFDEVEVPRTIMTISLAGAPGPRSGMTPMAGRAIPTPPPEPAPRPLPAPSQPAAAAAPARPTPSRPRQQPEAEAPPQTGATRTDTGARGQGFGLATGGSGGSGVQLDVSDFCCPEYIEQMVALIQQNWQLNQGITGNTVTKFTITRTGGIEQIQVERSSGFQALDLAATQALQRTRLPPLPAAFPNPTLGVHVTFEYQRR